MGDCPYAGPEALPGAARHRRGAWCLHVEKLRRVLRVYRGVCRVFIGGFIGFIGFHGRLFGGS